MGPANQQPLVSAVDRLALDGYRGEGATAAVQARLARRRLPTVGRDGLVRYVQLDRDGDGLEADIAWVEFGASRDSGSAAVNTATTPGPAERHSPTLRRTYGTGERLDRKRERRAYEVMGLMFTTRSLSVRCFYRMEREIP